VKAHDQGQRAWSSDAVAPWPQVQGIAGFNRESTGAKLALRAIDEKPAVRDVHLDECVG